MRKNTIMNNIAHAEALAKHAQGKDQVQPYIDVIRAGHDLLKAQMHFRETIEAAGMSVRGASAADEDESFQMGAFLINGRDEPDAGSVADESAAEESEQEEAEEAVADAVADAVEEQEEAEEAGEGDAPTPLPQRTPSKEEMQRMFPPARTDAEHAKLRREATQRQQEREREQLALRRKARTA